MEIKFFSLLNIYSNFRSSVSWWLLHKKNIKMNIIMSFFENFYLPERKKTLYELLKYNIKNKKYFLVEDGHIL